MMYIDREVSQSIEEQDTIVFNAEAGENFLSASKEFLAKQSFDRDDFIGSIERVPLKVGDTESVMRYYRSILGYLQQHDCSVIIRAVIMFIEPQKNAKHLYNGGDPTKPTWWSSGITDKQLGDMRKEDLIERFLQMFRTLDGYGLTADKLKEIAKEHLWEPRYVQAIYELCRVRKIEERFERGEVDDSTVIYVKKASSSAKGNGEDDCVTSLPRVTAVLDLGSYFKQNKYLAPDN